MDTIQNFYTNPEKNANYASVYELEHGKRHDEIVDFFKLKEIKNQLLLNVGGGLGFLEKRLDKSNTFVIVDGSNIMEHEKLCNFIHIQADANKELFLEKRGYKNFYAGFIFEVLEHLTDPYTCLCEIKKSVIENNYIYISIPESSVTHNTIYPGLIYPVNNFVQFLRQMALPVENYFLFENGFKSHVFKCRNANWSECHMLFYKEQEKFRGKTPLEQVNI